MSFKIDKHVPLPDTSVGQKKYPFGDMEVGDSFWAPISSDRLQNATGHWRDKMGYKFSVRAEEGIDPETGETVKGARCWRTK